ncbi:unnamed protein product [Didymodactylos carnosus]|uniref:Dynactin subunit 5 n=1 Tax=Didymodactylos carnosus TaxID=1234261 RepID=A0A815KSU1_9BILA|nr:unnamed protein product [Didymodactylos carnosus]CAF1397731.1 unnamed protein product [Didymodactylos carnosus]CAF4159856.1 unnamed protein product [Didymodactylos carnosus]CAF4291814.1 unnamed protein product [Didymodactylos carnosus]
MELPEVFYKKADFIETTSGNKVCRRSIMCGSQNIVLQGKTIVMADCIVRGDLAAVKIGKNCVICEKCAIRPPFKKFAKGVAFFPIQIGDHVYIEDDCVINAASIGSYVHIGRNSVIGRRCILMDCCVILPNSVIPPETVVPSFTVYGGSPACFIEEFPETAKELMIDVTQSFYQNFKPTV